MSFTATPSSSQQEDSNSGALIAKRLTEKSSNYKKLIAVVLSWTGKEPFLTQMLCKLIAEAESTPPDGEEEEWVETLVRERWLAKWEEREEFRALRGMRDRLVKNKPRNIQLLQTYKQILQAGEIVANNSPEQRELRLLGLVAQQQGKTTVHNRIYGEIFDLPWVEKTLHRLERAHQPKEDKVLQTFAELERQLLISQVNILAQAEQGNEDRESAQTLYAVLREVTATVRDLLGADRTTIFLLNDERTELWSLVAQGEGDEFLDIQVPVGEGIAGQVAASKQIIHIADNVYDDPRSELVQEFDKKYNYYTKNILAFPILDDRQELISVIQLLNKLEQPGNSHKGFTGKDLERLAKCVVPIRRILEICQSCYQAMKKLRATAALAEATRSLDRIDLDSAAALQRIMDAAKKLMNADRSTLWVADSERGDLWTEIPGQGEVRCQVGVGFVGQVAQSRQPTIIPFDLYDDPNAENAKKVDEQTRYRTCSLLCMPVFSPDGELVGVTQLVNKRKAGDFPAYPSEDWPEVPDYLRASFDKNDRQSMQVFNERVGVILQYLKTHQTLKESRQHDPQTAVRQTLDIFYQSWGTGSPNPWQASVSPTLDFIDSSLRSDLGCESARVFLLNNSGDRLWLLVGDRQGRRTKMVRIAADRGVAGAILASKAIKVKNQLGTEALKDPLLTVGTDSKKGQNRPQNILLFPLANAEGKIIALIRSLNKFQSSSEQIDPQGFTKADAKKLLQRSKRIVPILQACRDFAAARQS